jgi:hypothetical protein
VKIAKEERVKIENLIKREHPNLRTMSGIVRLALSKFLDSNPS